MGPFSIHSSIVQRWMASSGLGETSEDCLGSDSIVWSSIFAGFPALPLAEGLGDEMGIRRELAFECPINHIANILQPALRHVEGGSLSQVPEGATLDDEFGTEAVILDAEGYAGIVDVEVDAINDRILF